MYAYLTSIGIVVFLGLIGFVFKGLFVPAKKNFSYLLLPGQGLVVFVPVIFGLSRFGFSFQEVGLSITFIILTLTLVLAFLRRSRIKPSLFNSKFQSLHLLF
ncbi:MAG: hypothetical protein EB164_09175, partial [Thaumarchaeota archaeon]|nr:hypothetical protein [Nitrososphaerota archaeon]